MQVRELRRWCDDNGGRWKEEIYDRSSLNPKAESTHRCVLNNDETTTKQIGTEIRFDDTAFVELKDGRLRAESDGETIEIHRIRWEHTSDIEQRDYEDEIVNQLVFDQLENLNRFDGLNGRQFGAVIDDDPRVTLERRFEIDVKKDPQEIEDQITTTREKLDEQRVDQFTRWEQRAESAIESGDEFPELHVNPGVNFNDTESWMRQTEVDGTLLWDRYQELREEFEETSSHESLPCPEDQREIEIQGDVFVEGEIEDVWCDEDETIVTFRDDRDEEHVLEGSPRGDRPIELRVGSTQVASNLPSDEIDFFGHRSPDPKEIRSPDMEEI